MQKILIARILPMSMEKKMDALIMSELKEIRKDLDFLKKQFDEDVFLTEEEKAEVDRAIKEHEKGETIPLEQLERELA